MAGFDGKAGGAGTNARNKPVKVLFKWLLAISVVAGAAAGVLYLTNPGLFAPAGDGDPVAVAAPPPTQTPVPTPEPTLEPSPKREPPRTFISTPAPAPTSAPALVAALAPTLAPVPAATPTPTPTLTPASVAAATPGPILIPRPTSTPSPTSMQAPTQVRTPEPTPMATPIPEPTPTATPVPTATTVPEPAVQVIYAIPSDRLHNTRYEAAINGAILHVQDWYADQLDGRTFAIEEPAPLVCEVEKPAEYFEGEKGWDRVVKAVQHCAPVQYWSDEYVWAIYIDAEFDCQGGGELGRGAIGITIVHAGDLKGLLNPATFTLCPGWPSRGTYGWIGGLAHELGHTFGLDHPSGCDARLDHCDHDALMWLGFYWDYPETYFTDEDVAILRSSPFISHRATRN